MLRYSPSDRKTLQKEKYNEETMRTERKNDKTNKLKKNEKRRVKPQNYLKRAKRNWPLITDLYEKRKK